MKRGKIKSQGVAYVFFFGLFLMPSWSQAQDGNTQERILAVFHPYRQGLPQVEGISSGMKIDQSNFQVAQEVLPPEILKYVQAGDFAITVQETTDMPLREEFIKATLAHYAQVELGDEKLKNYVAGLPFPLLDPQDAEAGRKIAWNLRYRDRGETLEYWPTDELRNSNGSVERTTKYYIAYKWGMHRPDPAQNVSQWEKEDVFSKFYSRMLAPADIEGSQMLFYSYDKDTSAHDQWVYDPSTRRTRKVVYNQHEALWGGELLTEAIEGFNGYLHEYGWKYVGEKVVLVPGPIQTAEPTWGGKGTWYPLDPWELRKVVVLEARPKGAHPVYSHRRFYIDLQTSHPLYIQAYDHEGNHKRSFIFVYFHPEFNPWNNEGWSPLLASQSSIDYQRERASVYQTHKVFYNKPLKNTLFNRSSLMRYGK